MAPAAVVVCGQPAPDVGLFTLNQIRGFPSYTLVFLMRMTIMMVAIATMLEIIKTLFSAKYFLQIFDKGRDDTTLHFYWTTQIDEAKWYQG